MIHQVPIKSLPQEWLWCETWCDDSTKKSAKTIDLVTVCRITGRVRGDRQVVYRYQTKLTTWLNCPDFSATTPWPRSPSWTPRWGSWPSGAITTRRLNASRPKSRRKSTQTQKYSKAQVLNTTHTHTHGRKKQQHICSNPNTFVCFSARCSHRVVRILQQLRCGGELDSV